MAVLVGLSAGLVVLGIIAELRHLMTVRRVSKFVGPPLETPSRQARAWEGRTRLQRLRRLLVVPLSTVRKALLIVVLVALVVATFSGRPQAFLAAAFAALLLVIVASRSESQARIERQMPGAVRLLVSGLRAGMSVPQTLALVARESPEPTRSEFNRARQEVDLGLSLDDALTRLADRTSRDYALVSTIVTVQHEVGGNLAQILDEVSDTLRERADLHQHAEAITAQQRLSALILTALPIVVFLYTFFVNRAYLDPLFNNILGRLTILLSGALLVAGWTAMRWMSRVGE